VKPRKTKTPFERFLAMPVVEPQLHPLAEAIQERGMTIAEAARILGISGTALKQVISWRRELGARALAKIGASPRDEDTERYFPRIPDEIRATREAKEE
jgi:hypothetical protein